LRDKFQATKIRASNNQIEAFRSISSKFMQTAKELSEVIQKSMEARGKHPTEEVNKLLTQARESDTDGRLNVTKLRRNLTLLFERPKDLALDSSQVKARKKALRERCGAICDMRPNSVVWWALHFPPSV
jgi:hypothetical protein